MEEQDEVDLIGAYATSLRKTILEGEAEGSVLQSPSVLGDGRRFIFVRNHVGSLKENRKQLYSVMAIVYVKWNGRVTLATYLRLKEKKK